MEATNESLPPDGGLISDLLHSADQFEEAACTGHNLIAAAAAEKILLIFTRFFPEAFQTLLKEDRPAGAGSPYFLSLAISNPVSSPDPAYAETVRTSVQKFKAEVES